MTAKEQAAAAWKLSNPAAAELDGQVTLASDLAKGIKYVHWNKPRVASEMGLGKMEYGRFEAVFHPPLPRIRPKYYMSKRTTSHVPSIYDKAIELYVSHPAAAICRHAPQL